MWYKMENSEQRFIVGGLISPLMFLGRLNTKIKSDLCRIIRLLQFVYLRWEYSLTLVYYNKCQYIDDMINYTDKTVKTNIRLRGDLHFAFSRTVLRELDQPIAWEPQDAVGRCQQRPILRTRTARVRYGYPGWYWWYGKVTNTAVTSSMETLKAVGGTAFIIPSDDKTITRTTIWIVECVNYL